MVIHKFGGASIQSVERIKQVAEIIKAQPADETLVVISAMGKTTNALEKIAEAFFDGRKDDAIRLFEQLKNQHLTMAKYLLVLQYNACEARLMDFFTEVEWLLHDKPVRDFDYYYDQIVCCGELLSSSILSYYLLEEKIPNTWVDVRDIFRTDNRFREANLDWEVAGQQIEEHIQPLLKNNGLIITQGFIGSTADNESTTFGREGSDYSAAIFANLLNAQSQTVWKDVPSIMSADPKVFPNAIELYHLNYNEIIEMAYYGAQVIHPKTIKPLFEKQIPLLVKCFLDPSLPGTIINHKLVKNLPPITILKKNQVLMVFQAKDYSFVGEHAVGHLYQQMEKLHLKPNMTQIGAIQFRALYDDDRDDRIEALAHEAAEVFDIELRKGLNMLTIRHYNQETIDLLLAGKQLLLTQKTAETIQVIYFEE